MASKHAQTKTQAFLLQLVPRCVDDATFNYETTSSITDPTFEGYVSPFRATPLDKLRNFCEAVSSLGLLKGDWKDQVVYDLGCGDGIVNVEMAKLFGTRGVGLDLDETLLAKANEAAAAQGVSHLVSFCKQDLNTADYSQATILFMYLLPEALEKLKPILESFLLREGALLIVEMWPLEKWEDQVLYSHDKGVFRVYGPKK